MLELGNAKLQLVEIVARNEIQLFDEAAQQRHRLLARADARSAHARRQLTEELLDDVGDTGTTGHDRAAVSVGAADASRAAPARPAPTAPP
jgi:hypothetical protein